MGRRACSGRWRDDWLCPRCRDHGAADLRLFVGRRLSEPNAPPGEPTPLESQNRMSRDDGTGRAAAEVG